MLDKHVHQCRVVVQSGGEQQVGVPLAHLLIHEAPRFQPQTVQVELARDLRWEHRGKHGRGVRRHLHDLAEHRTMWALPLSPVHHVGTVGPSTLSAPKCSQGVVDSSSPPIHVV